jgi:hypothetical protein
MRPVILTASTSPGGVSPPCVLDQYLTPTDTTLAVELNSTSGGSYTVQYSPDDPFATYATDYNTNAHWYNHPTLVTLSADAVDNVIVPVRAVRLATTTVGTGATATPTLTVIQAGIR